MAEIVHIPVLAKETMAYLKPELGGRFIDGTLGQGGHSELILSASEQTQLLGIDRDIGAIQVAKERLARFAERSHFARGNYADMGLFAEQIGWDKVDGILLDIGFGSHQLDDSSRGFSFRGDGYLDMRMDRRNPRTAALILNHESEKELTRIFKEYGEERMAGSIARAVVAHREKEPFARIPELVEVIKGCVGNPQFHLPVLTRCFQALRIVVNDELGQLERGLEAAYELLAPGGRLVVISFHSLEDRMVKQFFREKVERCTCPPRLAVCLCGNRPEGEILTRKAIVAGAEEVERNSRSSCAKLRAFRKSDV